jgi:glyoxylase-like metal-dependent hydrolase (beta-lactamase superfamily II)
MSAAMRDARCQPIARHRDPFQIAVCTDLRMLASCDVRRGWINTPPTDIGHIDLGDRVLDAIPIPGHSKLSVALYDRRTSILFSGDSLYPGRLYVFDFPAFEASIARLVQFTADRPIAQVLGNHVEQTSMPFHDYPIGTLFQASEHELALSRGSLLELQAVLAAMHGAPRRLGLRDFAIWPAGPEFVRPDEMEQFKRYIEDQRTSRWQRTPAP